METNNQPDSPKMPNWVTPKVLWSAIGVLLLVVVVSCVAWYQIIKSTPAINPEMQVQSINQPTGLRTYTNNQYGFKFNYPSNWQLDSGSGGLIGLKAEYKNIPNRSPENLDGICLLDFFTADRNTNEDLTSWLGRIDKRDHNPDPGTITNITVDSRTGIQIQSTGTQLVHSVFLPLQATNILTINLSCGQDTGVGLQDYNQILSTVKFTN